MIGLLVLIGALLCPSPAPAAPLELSLSLIIPSRHNRYVHVLDPWVKMIEEKTKGNVKITPYFANSLAPTNQMFESTVSGLADISEGLTYANPGRFPLTETLMLPEVQAEYKGVKVLWLHAAPPLKLTTTKKAVRNLDDLKNMKIWVTGSVPVVTGKALGFSPVPMAPGDVYLALEKGVIDGAIADNEIFVSRKFVDISKYFTELDITQVAFYVVMNQQKWDSLPPEVKKVLEELSGDWAVEFSGKIRDEEEKEAEQAAKAKGTTYIQFSGAEKDKVSKILAPVKEKYVSDLEAKGLPGKKVLQELIKFAK
jgi:TRAP-type C4-dicarboxylate transport system substrate-binding protein